MSWTKFADWEWGRRNTETYEGLRIHKGFLVVQWIGIHLLVCGTQVQSLAGEDSACLRTDKPMHHSY